MRSILFSLVTLLALGGAFAVYFWTQPQLPHGDSVQKNPTTVQGPTSGPSQIGPGERPWIYGFQNGQPVSRFRAAEYEPQKDGSFAVQNPVAEFFLHGGQVIRLQGNRGVVYSNTNDSSAAPFGSNQMPTRGRLTSVHVELLPVPDSTQPTLTLDMPNVGYDFDTLRLYTTDGIDANGITIAADQVPVTVRGDEYEFDGRGLVLRWNDRDQRLQLLEIVHGRRLLIRNPAKLNSPWAPAKGDAGQAYVGRAGNDQLASTDGSSVAMLIGSNSSSATAPASTQPVYHASFSQDVHILHGGQQVALADIIHIDFRAGSTKPPATWPATSTRPSPTANSTLPAHSNPPTTRPQPATTATKDDSILITWVGPLRVTPVESPASDAVLPGQAIVKMEGLPVVVNYNGATVRAAAVRYRHPEGALWLDHSAELPLVLLDHEKGAHFATESLVFDPATHLATLTGSSELRLPMQHKQPDTKREPEVLTASWKRTGVVHFVDKPGSTARAVDRVDLAGDAIIKHPQFDLKSHQLAFDLEPDKTARADAAGASGERLKRVTADGNVAWHMASADGPRSIAADHLMLDTTTDQQGRTVPRLLSAQGHVRAADAQQELTAGQLEAAISTKIGKQPADAKMQGEGGATQQQFQLDSLTARDTVHAALKNGVIADADELHISRTDEENLVHLLGRPATVTDGRGRFLSGPDLKVWPDRSTAQVSGAGKLRAPRREPGAANNPARPMEITWSDSLDADLVRNTVDARGVINASSTDADGTIYNVTGDSAHVTLEDPPAPTTKATVKATTQPASAGKQLHGLVIRGHVALGSILKGPDEVLLRRAQLQSELLNYQATTGTLDMPGPGKLLLEDYRPAARGVDAGETHGPTGDTRGAVAMRWSEGLVYDKSADQLTFNGQVRMGYQPLDRKQPPIHLDAANLVAIMEPAVPVGSSPVTTAPAKVRLSSVKSGGGVRITSKSGAFECDNIDFNPNTGKVLARGSANFPGRTYDENSVSTGEFDELIFDAKTQQIDSVKGARGSIRR